MRKNIQIILITIVIVALIGSISAYILLTPQYESIELNGYTFEVPKSGNNVTKVNDNYYKYDDNSKNISIKSYAINNLNETDYNGSFEVGYQIGSNIGQNTTIENKTVLNQSGKYTYFDISTYQNLVITCDDYETMSHIMKSLIKAEITPAGAENINLLTITNNTTDDNNTSETTTKKSTTKKSTSTKKSYSSKSDDTWGDYEDDEWVYGHGAGSYDDPDITWKHNKKTGYGEYYNHKTGESWGGYNIA